MNTLCAIARFGADVRYATVAFVYCAMAFAGRGQAPSAIDSSGRTNSALSDWRAPPLPRQPAGTVSVELLRHPISEPAKALLRKAMRAANAGDHTGAIKQLNAALAKYPSSDAHVYSILGVEYLRTEQYEEAVNSLERAAELLPHDATNHSNLGLSLITLKQFDRAEAELQRALELDATMTKTRQLLQALRDVKSTVALTNISR